MTKKTRMGACYAQKKKIPKSQLNLENAMMRPIDEIADHLCGVVGAIRGHFWVELADGTVIDPYFEQYDAIKYMKDLEGDVLRRPVGQDIQRSMMIKHILPIMKQLKSPDFRCHFEGLRSLVEMGDTLDDNNFRGGYCHANSVINKFVYGKDAKIVYGDMGWKLKGKNEIFWEFEDGWDGKHDTRINPIEMLRRLNSHKKYRNIIMENFV